jgi:23S rRNA (pseudouridine1915-N3)-methyltransferase
MFVAREANLIKSSARIMMQIRLIMHGKTRNRELETLTGEYIRRIGYYARLEVTVIPELKNTKGKGLDWIREQEDQSLLRAVGERDTLILLDEKGKSMSSRGFSAFLSKQAELHRGPLCFAIGGAFGFGEAARNSAHGMLSLSPMTFSHEMVRLFFAEQLYRAFTILRNESYHHD